MLRLRLAPCETVKCGRGTREKSRGVEQALVSGDADANCVWPSRCARGHIWYSVRNEKNPTVEIQYMGRSNEAAVKLMRAMDQSREKKQGRDGWDAHRKAVWMLSCPPVYGNRRSASLSSSTQTKAESGAESNYSANL